MREILVAAWVILCGLGLLVLYASRRRRLGQKIIKMVHLGLAPEFDPRILLFWGYGAIGMGLIVLVLIAAGW